MLSFLIKMHSVSNCSASPHCSLQKISLIMHMGNESRFRGSTTSYLLRCIVIIIEFLNNNLNGIINHINQHVLNELMPENLWQQVGGYHRIIRIACDSFRSWLI